MVVQRITWLWCHSVKEGRLPFVWFVDFDTCFHQQRRVAPIQILCSKRESILLNFENKLSSTGSLAMVKTLVLWLINEVPCEVIGWLSRLPPLQDSQNSPCLCVLHAFWVWTNAHRMAEFEGVWFWLLVGVLHGPGYCASNLDVWKITLNHFFVGSWDATFEFTYP